MKTIKTIIVLLAAALLAWALPWCYAFVCSEPQESPLTLYSCVTHDFATFSFEGHDDAAGYDPAGNPYTERQFDSIMPTVFTRRLAEEGRLPERIDGIPFDAREVELSNFVFRASPSELNRPQIGLYQLLESAPGREGFRTPDDVFRITERGIEFVKMADNRIDAEKSERFDRVMKKKGFVFPARRIAGNASTYKHYDNGYLLLDATGTAVFMGVYFSDNLFAFSLFFLAAVLILLLSSLYYVYYSRSRDEDLGIPNSRAFCREAENKYPLKYSIALMYIDEYERLLKRFGRRKMLLLKKMFLKRINKTNAGILVYNYKADAFILAFMNANAAESFEKAEEVRRILAKSVFVFNENNHLQLTVSQCVSEKKRSDADAAAVLVRAEENLQKACRFTRNITIKA